MRLISVFIAAVLVIFAPWWLYMPAIFLLIVYFDFFVEGIVLAALIDIWYGKELFHGLLFGFPFTISAIILVSASVFVRAKLRLNA